MMRTFIYFIICAILFTTSCAGTNKRLRSGSNQDTEDNISGEKVKTMLMPATPIREVEEKVVSDNEKEPAMNNYYVIIGSFRNPANAKTHQTQILNDGFVSTVLKNEEGLYRVSVMATDNIDEARAKIRNIWAKYKKYSDTWLLKRKLD